MEGFTKTKKILFMEAKENLFGHVRQNESIVNALSELGELSIVFPEGWLTNIPHGVKSYVFKPRKYHIKENIAEVFKSLACMNYARKLDKNEQFDCIIFASFNMYAMGFVKLLFKNSGQRINLIHHNTLDQLNSSFIKRVFFKAFKNSTRHILIERFMAELFAKATRISPNRIFYFSHQLNIINKKINEDIDYLGISNSNDEQWINEIIKKERDNKEFKEKKIRVILRSKKMEFDDSFLTVFTGYISDEEYYNYISRSRVVLVPFPQSFRYRVSGSVVDAFSNRKRVVGSDIPVIDEYKKRYPNICKTGVSFQEILDDHEGCNINCDAQNKDFDVFIREHSFSTMKDEFAHVVNGVSNLSDSV